MLRSALTSFLVFGVISAADMGRRSFQVPKFQLGTDLPAVAKQAGVTHPRPR